MARLRDMVPPGEIIRWVSQTVGRPRRLAAWSAAYVVLSGVTLFMSWKVLGTEHTTFVALLFAGMGSLLLATKVLFASHSEAIITEGHVIWARAALLFGAHRGTIRLRDIRAVELEEGEDASHLRCEGATHRIALAGDSDLDAMARAIGRPARIWRKCTAPGAGSAKFWQVFFAASVAGATAGGTAAAAFRIIGGDGWGPLAGALVGAGGALLAQFFADSAKLTLPHLLVGRRLVGQERRDFVGWMTDLRWRGMKPGGPEDERLPHSRLQDWAMRIAYGGIPDIGDREPEILIRGTFPPDPAGADET